MRIKRASKKMPKPKITKSGRLMQERSTDTGSAAPSRPSWLKPFLPQIMAAALGFLGVVIGAWTTGHQQLAIEQQRDAQAEKQRRLDRAEQIITLIEKTPVTYLEAKKAMLLEPSHIAVPPSDAERVTTLVTLYFPDAADAARSYEAACAEHGEMLSEIAIQIAQGVRPFKDDSGTYQKMLSTGDRVTAKVLEDVGVSYKRRGPVVLPTDLR
jgi:hypothetical protein